MNRKLSDRDKISSLIFLVSLLWMFLGYKFSNIEYFFLVSGVTIMTLRITIANFINDNFKKNK